MPNILTALGYKIYFWSNESAPQEPIHVHISKIPQENATKVWIKSDGTVELENNNSQIPPHMLNKLLKTIELFSEEIVKAWKEHFKEDPTYHNENEEDKEI